MKEEKKVEPIWIVLSVVGLSLLWVAPKLILGMLGAAVAFALFLFLVYSQDL